MRAGLLLFTWGLFKKVVIADRLGSGTDLVYDDVHAYTGLSLLLATYQYAFQIYCDFSGYTDMALGSAQLFNIRLRQNFNSPYLAESVSDFWRRWHISFSSWILDYIFKPLQMQWRGLRTGGTVLALLVTFGVSGIWHGASWGFVIWGLLHGVYLSAAVLSQPWRKKIAKKNKYDRSLAVRILRVFITFNLVSFAWIFFRANSLSDALYVVRSLTCNLFQIPNPVLLKMFAAGLLCIAFIYLFDIFRGKRSIEDFVFARKTGVRWLIYYGLVGAIFFLGVFGQSKFIYFQF
jgi:D-alanyl-lipoteichoic acid acyltransferase DltB (MBOAT superfamily)